VFGSGWQVGIGGLLAGLVLLMVAAPLSWLLAGMLLAAELVVRAALTGWPAAPAWFGTIYVVIYYVDDAAAFFGLVRLVQIVGEVEQVRAAAGLAVAAERLQVARELQAAIGKRLAGIAAMAAQARRELSRDAGHARAQIAAAGAAARDAIAQAREVRSRRYSVV
jgi:signal transduction histidine kinase